MLRPASPQGGHASGEGAREQRKSGGQGARRVRTGRDGAARAAARRLRAARCCSTKRHCAAGGSRLCSRRRRPLALECRSAFADGAAPATPSHARGGARRPAARALATGLGTAPSAHATPRLWAAAPSLSRPHDPEAHHEETAYENREWGSCLFPLTKKRNVFVACCDGVVARQVRDIQNVRVRRRSACAARQTRISAMSRHGGWQQLGDDAASVAPSRGVSDISGVELGSVLSEQHQVRTVRRWCA